ncbi:MAG: hypothetical protein IKW45_08875 [Clostridia bacterium]|nr:hypothetical protein [Clostridia bacterium]
MAAKCPQCGHTLKIWNAKAECPECGTNIPNYQWEKRLNDDADFAEHAFAKMHYKTANFKSATAGSKLRIVRLVMTFAPLIALVLPLYNFTLTLPFRESSESVSFLTFILNYLLKVDIGSVLKLIGGEVVGDAALKVVIACALLLVAVVCGVSNFFVLLISGIKLRYRLNIALNFISTISWGVAAVFFAQFTSACTGLGGGIVTECSLGIGFVVGCILFAINFVLNVIVGKDLKKQMKEQPSMDEFIANEIASLRK